MEPFPASPIHYLSELLKQSDDLASRSEQSRKDFRILSKRLAVLNADSVRLINHSRRLCGRSDRTHELARESW